MVRRHFTLDPYTDRLLQKLAGSAVGNLSAVVRSAIHCYADLETRLNQIEKDPGFIALMERSEANFREGRMIPHEELKIQLRGRKKAARIP